MRVKGGCDDHDWRSAAEDQSDVCARRRSLFSPSRPGLKCRSRICCSGSSIRSRTRPAGRPPGVPRRWRGFVALVANVDRPPAAAASLVDAAQPELDHAGYQELLREIPLVLRAFGDLQPGARESIGKHLGRSADGMSRFVVRSGGPRGLELDNIEDLHAYCYAVAGIVGEMLTELFLLGRPALAGVAEQLRKHAAAFGEGLQLVNILKDSESDAAEGRVYLPRSASTREVFAVASRNLAAAAAYTEALRAGGAELGLVAFNAFVTKLGRREPAASARARSGRQAVSPPGRRRSARRSRAPSDSADRCSRSSSRRHPRDAPATCLAHRPRMAWTWIAGSAWLAPQPPSRRPAVRRRQRRLPRWRPSSPPGASSGSKND